MTSRIWKLLVGFSLMVFFISPHLRAQQTSIDDLKKEIQALSQSVGAMQKDIQEIKALLQKQAPAAPPQNVNLELGKSPARGNASAKLTMIEFSDYQCPFCSRHFRETIPQINKEYVDTGKVKYVFVNIPLESIHKLAFKGSVAANCAGEQGARSHLRI